MVLLAIELITSFLNFAKISVLSATQILDGAQNFTAAKIFTSEKKTKILQTA